MQVHLKRQAWHRGVNAEREAERFLKRQGLRLKARNFNTRWGEIDLIFLSRETVVFVEVRYRQALGFGDALSSVTYQKQQKLRKAAAIYLHRNSHLARLAARFDVVAIDSCEQQAHQLTWIQDAFQ